MTTTVIDLPAFNIVPPFEPPDGAHASYLSVEGDGNTITFSTEAQPIAVGNFGDGPGAPDHYVAASPDIYPPADAPDWSTLISAKYVIRAHATATTAVTDPEDFDGFTPVPTQFPFIYLDYTGASDELVLDPIPLTDGEVLSSDDVTNVAASLGRVRAWLAGSTTGSVVVDYLALRLIYDDGNVCPVGTTPVTVDIPATVVALNGMTAVGSNPISTDDDGTSYVHAERTSGESGFIGYNFDVNFPATPIPGTVASVSLVLVAKGTDSRSAGGSFGARMIITDGEPDFNTTTWTNLFTNNTADWTEFLYPLTLENAYPPGTLGTGQRITQAMIEAGTVEYNPGYALFNDGSSTGAWHTYFTYIALRVIYCAPISTAIPPNRLTNRDDMFGSALSLTRSGRSRQGGNRLTGYL